MSIGPTTPIGGPVPIDPRDPIRAVDPKTSLPPIQDRIDISEAGKLLADAMSIEAVRAERIQEIRKSIEAGTLETPQRVEGALRRFLEQNRDVLSA